MERRIGAREANQHLSRYLDSVERGDEIVITRRGRPVARLVPVPRKRQLNARQIAARERTLARMNKGYHLGDAGFDRERLHER